MRRYQPRRGVAPDAAVSSHRNPSMKSHSRSNPVHPRFGGWKPFGSVSIARNAGISPLNNRIRPLPLRSNHRARSESTDSVPIDEATVSVFGMTVCVIGVIGVTAALLLAALLH